MAGNTSKYASEDSPVDALKVNVGLCNRPELLLSGDRSLTKVSDWPNHELTEQFFVFGE
jgi:hypothetical protein